MSASMKFCGKKRAKITELASNDHVRDFKFLYECICEDLKEVRKYLNHSAGEFHKLVHEDEEIKKILETDESSKAKQVHDLLMKNFHCCEEEHKVDTKNVTALLNKYIDDETGELLKEEPPLVHWTFKFNENTENSYILYPSVFRNIIMEGGKVLFDNWQGKREVIPVAWQIFKEEIDRPVFYSAKYGGWIVSLRLYKLLLAWGATTDKPCYDESDDE